MNLPLGQSVKFKAVSFFYSSLIFLFTGVILYNQRGNLTTLFHTVFEGSPVWWIIQDWQFREWLPMFVLGPFSFLSAYFTYWFRTSKRKRDAPEKFTETAFALNTKMDIISAKLDWLSRVVNPVLTKKGVELQFDSRAAAVIDYEQITSQEERKRLLARKEELERVSA